MAASDALPIPRKNVAYRLYFDFRTNAGAIVTTVTGADTEISKDGAAFADATNEFTEIGTSGPGYIDLTSTEMNADSVVIKATCTNTDAVPVTIYLYPQELADIKVDVTHVGGATTNVSALATNVAAILEDTGTTLPATLTTIDNEIGVIDGIVDQILADTGTDGVVVSAAGLATDAVNEIRDALLAATVETRANSSINLAAALRILIAVAAGQRSGNTYLSPDGTANRVVGTVAGGDRTAITVTTTT